MELKILAENISITAPCQVFDMDRYQHHKRLREMADNDPSNKLPPYSIINLIFVTCQENRLSPRQMQRALNLKYNRFNYLTSIHVSSLVFGTITAKVLVGMHLLPTSISFMAAVLLYVFSAVRIFNRFANAPAFEQVLRDLNRKTNNAAVYDEGARNKLRKAFRCFFKRIPEKRLNWIMEEIRVYTYEYKRPDLKLVKDLKVDPNEPQSSVLPD